jgi:hypothetical protein
MPDNLKRQIILTLYLADHPFFAFKIVNVCKSMSIWDMSVSLTVGLSERFRAARFGAGLPPA